MSNNSLPKAPDPVFKPKTPNPLIEMAFRVPNDEAGLLFCRQAQAWRTERFRRVEYRGTHDRPRRDSNFIAVYLRASDERWKLEIEANNKWRDLMLDRLHNARQDAYAAEQKAKELEAKVELLNGVSARYAMAETRAIRARADAQTQLGLAERALELYLDRIETLRRSVADLEHKVFRATGTFLILGATIGATLTWAITRLVGGC